MPNPSTDRGRVDETREAEIRARCEQATTGPWAIQGAHNDYEIIGAVTGSENGWSIGTRVMPLDSWTMKPSREDTEFIAHARTDIPDLLAELSALRQELGRVREDIATWGIVEIGVRNPNVLSYMTHWETRALTAEGQVATLRTALNSWDGKAMPAWLAVAIREALHAAAPSAAEARERS